MRTNRARRGSRWRPVEQRGEREIPAAASGRRGEHPPRLAGRGAVPALGQVVERAEQEDGV